MGNLIHCVNRIIGQEKPAEKKGSFNLLLDSQGKCIDKDTKRHAILKYDLQAGYFLHFTPWRNWKARWALRIIWCDKTFTGPISRTHQVSFHSELQLCGAEPYSPQLLTWNVK